MKKLAFLLVFCTALFCSKQGNASHLYGTDMTWESLGGDSFLITLKQYRDCNGIHLNALSFFKRSKCGTKSFNTIGNKTVRNVTPICSTFCTRCESSSCAFKYGIELWEYKGVVNLSDERKNGCCWVNIDFKQCCLSSAYTNIKPDALFHTLSINICLADGEKSPQLSNPPVVITAIGKDISLSLGKDRSKDSVNNVIYSMAPLMSSQTTPITVTGAYTYDNPLSYLSFPDKTKALPRGFHLDSNSGTLKFRPMAESISGYGVRMEQYNKNGILIGVTNRFITNIIIKFPKAASFNNSTKTLRYNKSMKDKLEYHVELGSVWHEGFRGDLVNVDSNVLFNMEIKGLTRAYQSLSHLAKRSLGSFLKDLDVKLFIDSAFYKEGDTIKASLELTAETCPYNIKDEFYITIIVDKKTTDTKTKIWTSEIDSVCGQYELKVPLIPNITSIDWIVNGYTRENTSGNDTDWIYNPFNADTQFIEVKYRGTDSIHSIFDTLIPRKGALFHLKNFPTKTFCQGEEYAHKIEFIDKNANPNRIVWNYNSVKDSGINVKFNTTTTSNFSIEIEDSISACKIDLTVPFKLKLNVTNANFFDTIKICSNDTFSLQLPLFGKKDERWTGAGVLKRRFYRDTLADGIHNIMQQFESNNYCVTRDQTITFTDIPQLKLDTGINVCHDENPILLKANYPNIVWSGEAVTNDIFEYTGKIAKTISVTAHIETVAGCVDQDSFNIHVGARNQSSMQPINDTAVCYFSMPLLLDFKNIGIGRLNMSNSDYYINDGKYYLIIDKLPVAKTLIKFTGADKWGCTSTDSLYVRRFRDTTKLTFSTMPKGDICEFDSKVKLKSSPSAETWFGTGVELISGDYYFNPAKGNAGENFIYTTITDSLGCVHLDTLTLKVKDSLNAVFSVNDTICHKDSIYTLPLARFKGEWEEAQKQLAVSSNNTINIDSLTTPGQYVFRRVFNKTQLSNYCFDILDFTLTIKENKKPKLVSDTSICLGDTLVKLRNYPNYTTRWNGAGVEKRGTDYFLSIGKQFASKTNPTLHIQDNEGVCVNIFKDQIVIKDTVIRPYTINQTQCSKNFSFKFPDLRDKEGKPLAGNWQVQGSGRTSDNWLYLSSDDYGLQKIYFELSDPDETSNPCFIGDTSYLNIIESPKIPIEDYSHSEECLNKSTIYYIDSSSYIIKGAMIDSFGGEYFYNHGKHNVQNLTYHIIKKGNKCPVSKEKKIRFIYYPILLEESDFAVCRQTGDSVEVNFTNTNGNWFGPQINNKFDDQVSYPVSFPSGNYFYTYKKSNKNCTDSLVKKITIKDKPVADFSFPTEKGETPYTIRLEKTANTRGSTFFWDFGTGDTLSSTEDQTFTYNDSGSFTIRMIAKSGLWNCTDTMEATISTYHPVGMADDASSYIAIYPNPAHNALTIELPTSDFITATIYNNLGQKVLYRSIRNENLVHLQIANLANGTYILELSNTDQSIRKTFIKQ